ncbi:uncharacterized protein LOC126822775 [Patella vulgata]|uniref:uncharacterized protein LOC126822775 n=1 Tax=Patella vulgata TaxID=6465 RepID=UPI0024A8E43A|nr:uncharacterized protein LOC126822775 [Patella vulgata]
MPRTSAFCKTVRSLDDLVHLDPVEKQFVTQATVGLHRLYKQISTGNSQGTQYSSNRTDEQGRFKPVIDDVLANRYQIKKTLQSQGQSAVIVKAKDLYGEEEDVIIKILHVVYYKIGIQETHCLLRLQSTDHCNSLHIVRLKTTFKYGPHFCMVFEALNPEPITVTFSNKTWSVSKKLCEIRKLTFKLLQILSCLKQQNTIHADLKPENILLQNEDDMHSVRVIDFGNAIHHVHKEVSLYYQNFELQTLLYRAPEVMYGIPFGSEVDMWSLGCILAELFLTVPLFDGKNKNDILNKISELLGPFPSDMFQRGKFYNEFHQFIGKYQQADATLILLKHLNGCYDYTFANFLCGLLKYDPDERLTPIQALQHPFLGSEFNMGVNLQAKSCLEKSFPLKSDLYHERPRISSEIRRQNPNSYDLLCLGTSSPEPDVRVAVICPVVKRPKANKSRTRIQQNTHSNSSTNSFIPINRQDELLEEFQVWSREFNGNTRTNQLSPHVPEDEDNDRIRVELMEQGRQQSEFEILSRQVTSSNPKVSNKKIERSNITKKHDIDKQAKVSGNCCPGNDGIIRSNSVPASRNISSTNNPNQNEEGICSDKCICVNLGSFKDTINISLNCASHINPKAHKNEIGSRVSFDKFRRYETLRMCCDQTIELPEEISSPDQTSKSRTENRPFMKVFQNQQMSGMFSNSSCKHILENERGGTNSVRKRQMTRDSQDFKRCSSIEWDDNDTRRGLAFGNCDSRDDKRAKICSKPSCDNSTINNRRHSCLNTAAYSRSGERNKLHRNHFENAMMDQKKRCHKYSENHKIDEQCFADGHTSGGQTVYPRRQVISSEFCDDNIVYHKTYHTNSLKDSRNSTKDKLTRHCSSGSNSEISPKQKNTYSNAYPEDLIADQSTITHTAFESDSENSSFSIMKEDRLPSAVNSSSDTDEANIEGTYFFIENEGKSLTIDNRSKITDHQIQNKHKEASTLHKRNLPQETFPLQSSIMYGDPKVSPATPSERSGLHNKNIFEMDQSGIVVASRKRNHHKSANTVLSGPLLSQTVTSSKSAINEPFIELGPTESNSKTITNQHKKTITPKVKSFIKRPRISYSCEAIVLGNTKDVDRKDGQAQLSIDRHPAVGPSQTTTGKSHNYHVRTKNAIDLVKNDSDSSGDTGQCPPSYTASTRNNLPGRSQNISSHAAVKNESFGSPLKLHKRGCHVEVLPKRTPIERNSLYTKSVNIGSKNNIDSSIKEGSKYRRLKSIYNSSEYHIVNCEDEQMLMHPNIRIKNNGSVLESSDTSHITPRPLRKRIESKSKELDPNVALYGNCVYYAQNLYKHIS